MVETSILQAAWYIRHVRIIWFLNLTYDVIINTQFYTKYRPRLFYVLDYPLKKNGCVLTAARGGTCAFTLKNSQHADKKTAHVTIGLCSRHRINPPPTRFVSDKASECR